MLVPVGTNQAFAGTATLGINIEKSVNGNDADSPTGPILPVGSTVTYSYTVTNTGSESLFNVKVNDDNGTPGDSSDDFSPTFTGGDTGSDGELGLSEIWIYSEGSTVVVGQHTNVATVTASDDNSGFADDSDPGNYFGRENGNGAIVGGELIPIDTTMVLLAGTHSIASWMIPVIVVGIGFAIVIARKF